MKASNVSVPKSYHVGTLHYSLSALLVVMFWMLLADLCLQIMEQLPSLIPLQLRALGASDTVIGFMKDGLAALLAVMLVPFIGMRGDRHRGPLGRRRPFLLWSTIPVCVFLIALGFVEPITQWIASLTDAVNPATIGLSLVALFATGFFVFNTVVVQNFQYLIRDVIPTEVMARFFGLFRAVGAIGGFIFNRWAFQHAQTHIGAVYTICALLYGFVFLLLVWQVKEGEYPEPPPAPATRPIAEFVAYFRICFSKPYYLKIFATSLLFWCSQVPFQTFIMFFALKAPGPDYATTLQMDAAAFGDIKAWTFLPKIFVAILIGPIIDRRDAPKIFILTLAAVSATYFLGYFVVVTPGILLGWWLLNETLVVAFLVAYLSMLPVVLPADRYGQYFGANQVFFSLGLVGAAVLCGVLLEALRDYRYIFLWSAILSGLGTVMAIFVRRDWIQHGRKPPPEF